MAYCICHYTQQLARKTLQFIKNTISNSTIIYQRTIGKKIKATKRTISLQQRRKHIFISENDLVWILFCLKKHLLMALLLVVVYDQDQANSLNRLHTVILPVIHNSNH